MVLSSADLIARQDEREQDPPFQRHLGTERASVKHSAEYHVRDNNSNEGDGAAAIPSAEQQCSGFQHRLQHRLQHEHVRWRRAEK